MLLGIYLKKVENIFMQKPAHKSFRTGIFTIDKI